MLDVIVVGGGIGGLTLSYLLQRAGLDVKLLESSPSAGGLISSEKHQGFLIEHGPNSSLSKPDLLELVKMLNLNDQLVFPTEAARKRYLVTTAPDGTTPYLQAAPENLRQAVTTPLLTLRGKLRVMCEPFISKVSLEDESVYSFLSRRLGKEAVDRVVEPALGGIWAANLRHLSSRSGLKLLWSWEQNSRSLTWGAFRHFRAKRQDRTSKNTPRAKLCSFIDGLSTLPSTITNHLKGDSLLCNSIVSRIEKRNNGTRVYYRTPSSTDSPSAIDTPLFLDAKKVVLAVPAKQAASLLEQFDAAPGWGMIRTVPYAPLGLLHLAYPLESVPHPLDGFGFLAPPALKLGFLGAIFSSSLFSGRSPQGWALVTCLAGGSVTPENAQVQDAKLQAQIIDRCSSLIGASKAPRIIACTSWEEAIPNYPLNHWLLQESITHFEQQNPEILLLGNWNKGISVADRISEATALATAIINSKHSG